MQFILSLSALLCSCTAIFSSLSHYWGSFVVVFFFPIWRINKVPRRYLIDQCKVSCQLSGTRSAIIIITHNLSWAWCLTFPAPDIPSIPSSFARYLIFKPECWEWNERRLPMRRRLCLKNSLPFLIWRLSSYSVKVAPALTGCSKNMSELHEMLSNIEFRDRESHYYK